jgi:mannose-1-phosphate guanylyltransferase/phosphomannomutase
MVPIAGKPCIEHIVDLLAQHGCHDVIVTLAYLPQAIRAHLGDGSSLGVEVRYSTEDVPLGTAGSVKRVGELLDDTFLVISGDALCDVDLGRLLAFHRARGAIATLAVKPVADPLEFGVVVAGDDGRIERFLEKPGWGQVVSDLINTGIYVVEPEALASVPADEPYDFSRQLFPALLAAGAPLYAHRLSADEYWQDIGTLEQYARANRDALEGRVRLRIAGVRLDGNVWLGEGATLADPAQVEGPAAVGSHVTIEPGARVGPLTCLGPNCVVR